MKLYDNTPQKTLLADKYRCRPFVAETIGEEYLVPLLGVWENADDIDFGALPDRFALKTNHGSGTNVIVKDKGKLNIGKARKKLNRWLKTNFAYVGFELQYKRIPPVIIAEEYIENMTGDVCDYKFYCFGGEPKYCEVDIDRYTLQKCTVFDLNWERAFAYADLPEIPLPFPKPCNFDQMVILARKLCQGFSHVRVDFYNLSGKIYFGEMTFTSSSGNEPFSPPEYDLVLGELIKL
jgi:hypothetical protein